MDCAKEIVLLCLEELEEVLEEDDVKLSVLLRPALMLNELKSLGRVEERVVSVREGGLTSPSED